MAIVVILVGLTLAVHWPGLYTSPARNSDEGAYAARAWSVARLDGLTSWPNIYDHPPLGWIATAGWYRLRGGPDPEPGAIATGRELVLIFQAVSSVLLYLLARAMGLTRCAAAVAGLLFVLSPLAALGHRYLLLDNLAMPLLLGALVVGRRWRRVRAGPWVAGAMLGLAALVKETNLLMVPVLALLLVDDESSAPDASGRRFPFRQRWLAAGAGLVAVAATWPLYAAVQGELVSGPGGNSLLDGLHFQLLGRAGSGSVLDGSSVRQQLISWWLSVDPWLPGLGLGASVIAAFVPPLRAISLAMAIALAAVVRPGYLPALFFLLALPFAALAVAGSLDLAWRAARRRSGRFRVLVVTVTGLVVVAAGPGWMRADIDLPSRTGDLAYPRAVAWLAANVSKSDVLLVDNTVWIDLVQTGFPPAGLVHFRELEGDQPPRAGTPRDWRGVDVVVTTDAMRRVVAVAGPAKLVRTRRAIDNSAVVARFSSGAVDVEVRFVRP